MRAATHGWCVTTKWTVCGQACPGRVTMYKQSLLFAHLHFLFVHQYTRLGVQTQSANAFNFQHSSPLSFLSFFYPPLPLFLLFLPHQPSSSSPASSRHHSRKSLFHAVRYHIHSVSLSKGLHIHSLAFKLSQQQRQNGQSFIFSPRP